MYMCLILLVHGLGTEVLHPRWPSKSGIILFRVISPVEFFWTYEFSKVQDFLVDLASHGVPEEI